LSTALVFTRAREVGIRKVLGSLRGQLMRYYLGEAFIVTLIALIISLAALPLVLGQMGDLIGKANQVPWGSSMFWGGTLLALVLVSLMAGLYPAHLLSRLKPVNAMKSHFAKRYGQGLPLRKSLIVLQFGISQILIICTLVMLNQMNYFQEAPLGFDKEAVVKVMLPTNEGELLNKFRNEMKTVPGVTHVAFSNSGVSSGNRWVGNFTFQPDSGLKIEEHAQVKFINEDFLSAFDLELVAGRELDPRDSTQQFLVNETLMREAQMEHPADMLGKPLRLWGMDGTVVGVVKDWHTTSLHDGIAPVVLLSGNDAYYMGAVKLSGDNFTPQLRELERVWSDTWPAHVFESEFLDASIEDFYSREAVAAKGFRLFAGIAILIGCLGLFGLISFMAAQRTKEIGIRKVLGATVGEILRLFTREFTVLILLGFVIAAPIAWYLMDNWLQDFAYRISVGATAFVVSIFASMAIAYLTIFYRAWQAARMDPSLALRNDQ
ncbi:MAG: FtsX-like permease family protein, partial [Bacteroidota bacterium]